MSSQRLDRDRSKTELRRGTASCLPATPTFTGTGHDEQAFLLSSLSHAAVADHVHSVIPASSEIPPADESSTPGARPV